MNPEPPRHRTPVTPHAHEYLNAECVRCGIAYGPAPQPDLAAAAVTREARPGEPTCQCGHNFDAHNHYTRESDYRCSGCTCPDFNGVGTNDRWMGVCAAIAIAIFLLWALTR